MAHTLQSKKRVRRNERRRVINRQRVTRIRGVVKNVELAIAGGDKEQAAAALKAAQPEITRGANKGLLHKNTASRRISRLSRRIAAL